MRIPIKPVFNSKFSLHNLIVLLWTIMCWPNFTLAQAPVCPQLLDFQITTRDVVICEGQTVSFGGGLATRYGGFNVVSYDWYLNGVLQPTNSTFTTNQIKSYDTVYAVVHVSVDGSCPAQATSNKIGFYVNPNVNPSVSITSSQTGAQCLGSPITFTATTADSGRTQSYAWQINGVTVPSNGGVTFTTTALKIGDQVNCVLTVSNTLCLVTNNIVSNSITPQFIPPVNPSPTISITASTNNVYHGSPVTFTATSANTGINTTYQWQVNGVNEGTNSITFTDSVLNNKDQVTCLLSTQEGCTVLTPSNTIVITIKPPPPITAPNTFTPNGDGINDTWKLSGLSFYPNVLVKVFNRYGIIVFQSRGYATPWDGTSANNRPLPDGVYYYIINPGNNSPELTGWLAILR